MEAPQCILILDFGGQYTQLIARRVRERGVYSCVLPCSAQLADIRAVQPMGIIFSGGPASVLDEGAPRVDEGVFELGVPVLGICYGMQLMAHLLGAPVERGTRREYGRTDVTMDRVDGGLLAGLRPQSPCWMSHTYQVTCPPEGFVAIAPALLLVCAMSALRGFMQGQQNMVPPATSQLIEQVGKVFISLPLAYFGMRISVAYAAAGVLLGTSIAEGVALLYMVVIYRRKRAAFDALPQNPDETPLAVRPLLKRLLSLSIPITLGACIVPIASFIDSGLLLNRLVDAGIERTSALGLYGRYSGYVLTLINVPTALAVAISMSLVPSISSAMARGDGKTMRRQSSLGLRLSFVVGLPCSIGMSLLSSQILSLIYHFDTPEALRVTAELLSLSSLTIVLFTVVQSTSGILQGLRKQRIPMYTLMAGVAFKVLLNYTLIGMPSINIYGAPIASLTCYTISMLPNLWYVRKYTGMKLDLKGILLRPALATALMGAVLALAIRLLPSGRLWTLVLVALGVCTYAAFALLTGALTRDDLAPLLRRFGRGRAPKKED